VEQELPWSLHLTRKGEVDHTALARLTNFLVDGGVDYLVVMGTTGESVTLSKQEKNDVLQTVLANNGGRLPVVLGVGGNNTFEICAELKFTIHQRIVRYSFGFSSVQ
jgi:4-hydroxy-tetrahydrodipicolinate synthase